jgi:glycosyltransferase involved in cell wall biosynthesis
MTILLIAPLPEPLTGQSLACRVLLEGLSAAHRVELVDLSKKELVQGLSSLTRVGEVLGTLWRVWRRQATADAIYLTVSQSLAGNAKDLVTFALCYRKLRHTVIHLHGGAGMREIVLGRRSLRTINHFFLKRLGGVIVLGDSHREIYRGIVPEERIHVVPNFAEDDLFTTSDGIDAKFDRPGALRVLFLSNLLPGKGHQELVEAFLSLDEGTKASIRVDLAGAFESTPQKERFLARIATDDRLRYHGVVTGDRKRALFEQGHVFCLPTYYPYEGQPISLLEAYAAGCAVVTTNHSGIPDVFQDGVNGLQVAKRSVADLRSTLRRIAAEPERLRQMAKTNLATALVAYRSAEYKQAVARIIETVARS